MPICLPTRKFTDNDKTGEFIYVKIVCSSFSLSLGYSVGFGVQKEALCKTDGVGPDVHRQCTTTMLYNYKGNMPHCF